LGGGGVCADSDAALGARSGRRLSESPTTGFLRGKVATGTGRVAMFRKFIVSLVAAAASLPMPLAAQTVVKIGLINSYTGFVAQPADQAQKGFDLCIKEHEKELPPGVKIELLRRDDTSNPEVGKRLAQ